MKVFIPVKSLTLTRDGGDYIGGFDVYVSTGDATGNASAVSRQKYQIRWPAAQIDQQLVEPLSEGLKFWAFVSVTNNKTQHFYTIVPR